MTGLRRLGVKFWEGALDLFSDEDGAPEPGFDPVHLGAVCIACLVGIGLLYWLLWTLLVYEGGLFSGGEGWFGNLAALALCGLALWALLHLYRTAEKGQDRAGRKPDA
jgi:hypothetical protein